MAIKLLEVDRYHCGLSVRPQAVGDPSPCEPCCLVPPRFDGAGRKAVVAQEAQLALGGTT